MGLFGSRFSRRTRCLQSFGSYGQRGPESLPSATRPCIISVIRRYFALNSKSLLLTTGRQSQRRNNNKSCRVSPSNREVRYHHHRRIPRHNEPTHLGLAAPLWPRAFFAHDTLQSVESPEHSFVYGEDRSQSPADRTAPCPSFASGSASRRLQNTTVSDKTRANATDGN